MPNQPEYVLSQNTGMGNALRTIRVSEVLYLESSENIDSRMGMRGMQIRRCPDERDALIPCRRVYKD